MLARSPSLEVSKRLVHVNTCGGCESAPTPLSSMKKIYTHTRLQRKIFFGLKEGILLSFNRLIESYGSLVGSKE